MINDWFPLLDSQKLGRIKQFKDILLKFNDTVNLISPSTVKLMDSIHLADCVMACEFFIGKVGDGPVFDLGSGNGLPGIVMGILSSELKITLVDRDTRKIEFMRHGINELVLSNVTCLVHNIGQDKPFEIKVGISRAMAPMGRILKTVSNYFSSGSRLFLMKSPKWESELATEHSHLERLWSWKVTHEYSLPMDEGKRVIIEALKK